MKRFFIVFVGLVFLHSSGIPWACSADNVKPTTRTKNAAQGGPMRKIMASGTIQPEEVIAVHAQAIGRVVSLGDDPHAIDKRIDYGSTVEADAVLARIDGQLYATRVEQERGGCMRADAELALARANLEYAKTQLRRAEDQKKFNKTIADFELDMAQLKYKTAEAAVAVAEAALVQSRAALKQAEIELSYTTIRSPVKGVVIDRRVNIGQTITPNSPSLFLIAAGGLKNLQVRASVNEADIGRIHPQQPVRFTVDAYPGKVFEGKVKQIRLNAAMRENVVTYSVIIGISSGTERLQPYLTANVEFQ